jgi:hypothetical protein
MKKRILTSAVTLIAVMFLLSGCFLNTDLAKSFDEKQVIEKGKQFVAMINDGNYDGCAEWFSDSMKKEATAADVKKLVEDKTTGAGSFVSFTGGTVSGTSQDGKDYAVCILVAKYENKEKVQYNVTFDTDMKVAGFFCQ